MSNDWVFCHLCTCERCRRNYTNKFCSICCFESGNAFIDDLIANSFDDLPNSSDHPPQHQTHSFESYNDNPNYCYPPQESYVYNQDSCNEQNFVDNSQSPPQPQYETYLCELCGNDSHYGYDCPPLFSLVYEQEPSYNQNDNDNYYPHNSPSFLCFENCGGPHATFQCQPMNQNSNSSGFDQIQPPQYHELAEYINSSSWNRPDFYDDDDDEYSIQVSEFLEKSPIAIALVLPTGEPKNSLSMGDENLDTISETESNKVIKSNVEDLVLIPSESEGIYDDMCDVPFSDKNHFDADSDLIKSLLTRDTLIVYSLKIDSLLEEFAGELVHIDPILSGIDETNSDPKDDIRFIEQLLYDDTSSEDDSFEDIDYVEASPPASELVGLEEVKDEILREKLLNIHFLIAKIESLNNNPTLDCVLKFPSSSFLSYTDNSSPEFETFRYHIEETSSGSTTTHANNSLPEYDLFLFDIEPDQDELTSAVMNDISDNSTNDPLIEEIDLFLTSDNLIPPGIENVDYDSEGDILFLEELLRNDFLSLPEFDSFHFDLYDDPSSLRPSKKHPDDGGILTTKVVDDISDNSRRELYVHLLNFLPSLPTLYLSHRGFKVFQLVNNYESPMMIFRGDIPFLDVMFLHFYPP
nr:hypothetical protein [Tanacetum cinerariifolium]